MTNSIHRRVATYERVSSEDQRDRGTIETQNAEITRAIQNTPDVVRVDRYVDDGISGTIPMSERPEGKRLLADAAKGRFDEVWVWKIDRLGRDDIDPLVVRRDLERLGVKVISITEGAFESPFMYSIHVAVAAEERRKFLDRSRAGMNRAAKEGRYCGGIVPYGYLVRGHKDKARLEPSDVIAWGAWTEADIIRRIYQRLAIDQWSCPQIASELNDLGVPTAYTKDGREVRVGKRKRKTQGVWRAGRIRGLVVKPIYRGEQQYGRRSSEQRDVVSAKVPSLVSEDIWFAAQETLGRNRIAARNAGRAYLLKSVIKCGVCGLNYCAAWDPRISGPWYRCNGQLRERGIIDGKCPSKSIKGPALEKVIWADIEGFLRNPGEIIEELSREREMDPRAAVAEAERITLEEALNQISIEQDRAIRFATKGIITERKLDELLKEIAEREASLTQRLSSLSTAIEDEPKPVNENVLAHVRSRLDKGLSDVERQEIVRLLVKRITIHTEGKEPGKKHATAVVEYKFPQSVVGSFTGRDSSRRRG